VSFCRLGAASQQRSDIGGWLGAFLVAVDAIDHEFDRVRVGVREDAVAQIEDMAGRAGRALEDIVDPATEQLAGRAE